MDINVYHMLIGIGIVTGINVFTFLLLYFMIGNKDKPKPLVQLKNSARIYWMLCSKMSKRTFWLEDLREGKDKQIYYADWNLGLGYGYMDKPLQVGDQILTKLPHDRFFRLVVAWVRQPDEDNAKYFLFKTYYLGTENGTSKEISKLKGFQCYL